MEEEKYKKLSEITYQLSSMTFILNGYCENFEQEVPEIANLTAFVEILQRTSEKLYDLL